MELRGQTVREENAIQDSSSCVLGTSEGLNVPMMPDREIDILVDDLMPSVRRLLQSTKMLQTEISLSWVPKTGY